MMIKKIILILSLIILLCACSEILISKHEEATSGGVRIFSVNPWDAKNSYALNEFVARAWEEKEDIIKLVGFKNDWLVWGAMVDVDEVIDLKADLDRADESKSPIDLKVAGEVLIKNKGNAEWRFDPLFKSCKPLGDLSKFIRNWEIIKDFPLLHLKPRNPCLLWVTINTKDMPAGKWKSAIILRRGEKIVAKMPVEVSVSPVNLPEDNPIIGHTWTNFGDDESLAKLALEYGLNTCGHYDNWDMLKKAGFRFFRFNVPPCSWNRASLKTGDDEVREYLKSIQDDIKRLGLKENEWAIEVFDEPADPNASIYVDWIKKIKRLWPGARFYANPGYSGTNKVFATVKGTIEPLKEDINVWCPYIAYLYQKSNFMSELKKTGNPVWYYTIEYSHQKPLAGGRQWPWLAWRDRLDGWGFYGLKEYGKDNPWTDNVCARMYPGNTVSIWLEGLRQGVQDYKRLWVLRQYGASCEEIDAEIIKVTPKGADSPWGGADPEVYRITREKLDDMVREKSHSQK
jgi:hypothetical protein